MKSIKTHFDKEDHQVMSVEDLSKYLGSKAEEVEKCLIWIIKSRYQVKKLSHISEGSIATALEEPFKMVISQSLAKKYFGDTDPMIIPLE